MFALRGIAVSHFLRAALLFVVGASGSGMAFAEMVANGSTEHGRFALCIARSSIDGCRCHHIRFCRAVISIAGTTLDEY